MMMHEDTGEVLLHSFATYLLAHDPASSGWMRAMGQQILLLLDERNALENALHEVQAEWTFARQTAQRHVQADEQAHWQGMVNTLLGLRQRTN